VALSAPCSLLDEQRAHVVAGLLVVSGVAAVAVRELLAEREKRGARAAVNVDECCGVERAVTESARLLTVLDFQQRHRAIATGVFSESSMSLRVTALTTLAELRST
jgi:hypothetical protein